MIIKKVLGLFECEDDLSDKMFVIEGVVYNTPIVDVKSINGGMETHIFLTKERAKDLGRLLMNWSDEKVVNGS